MKNFFILCCLWIACCAISAQEPCPQVIPALQQWKGGSGKLALPAKGNIVVNPADEAVLLSTAEILADDLSMMMGWNYSVKIGKPGKNDIYMALMKPDKELGMPGLKRPPERECSGEPVRCYRCFISSRERFRKERHATSLYFLTVVL